MKKETTAVGLGAVLSVLLGGCSGSGKSEPALDTSAEAFYTAPVQNRTAYITSQCYTKTEDGAGKTHNPCFCCHVNSRVPNYVDDGALQESYPAVTEALHNPWKNLFIDRTAAVEAMDDAAILAYVREDNYKNGDGVPGLVARLRSALPAAWDSDGNGAWDGYVPDCYFNFDDDGFDRNASGGYTGWRAFAYYPFLGTFWPTNGSADDAMIRLAAPLRTDTSGRFDREVYTVNLAVVEALITRRDVGIDAADETRYGVDLDKDGRLGTATKVAYDWAPLEGRSMSYVGGAKQALENGLLHLAAGLYPEGTEFLHSVRYLDVRNGSVVMAPRMKELRYGIKNVWYTYSELRQLAEREALEKQVDPEKYRRFAGNYEFGYYNAQGWRYQGFIEDAGGELRPQNNEETLYCMGCHGGIGATQDTVFSFGRKFDHTHHKRGWFHWSEKGLEGEPEPKTADGRYEYALYLATNHAGDAFRHNDEVRAKFFDGAGALRTEEAEALHDDIARLLLPSAARAVTLDKAYKVIVDEQSFTGGRDAHVRPVESVYKQVKRAQPTRNEKVTIVY